MPAGGSGNQDMSNFEEIWQLAFVLTQYSRLILGARYLSKAVYFS